MPLEIKELHIKVAVDASPEQQRSEIQQTWAGNISSKDFVKKDLIVAECVEQVMQIIRNKAER